MDVFPSSSTAITAATTNTCRLVAVLYWYALTWTCALTIEDCSHQHKKRPNSYWENPSSHDRPSLSWIFSHDRPSLSWICYIVCALAIAHWYMVDTLCIVACQIQMVVCLLYRLQHFMFHLAKCNRVTLQLTWISLAISYNYSWKVLATMQW